MQSKRFTTCIEHNMKITLLFFVCLLQLKIFGADEISAKFVRDYYTDRNIHQIVVFNCWDPHGAFTSFLS